MNQSIARNLYKAAHKRKEWLRGGREQGKFSARVSLSQVLKNEYDNLQKCVKTLSGDPMHKDIRTWSSLRLEECKVEIYLQIICVHVYIEIKYGSDYKIYVSMCVLVELMLYFVL